MIRIADTPGWIFPMGELHYKVREWYTETFPDDEMGPKIKENVTFLDLVGLLNCGLGSRFYDMLGAGDSIVRERVFGRIAKICGCDYDDVYHAWLGHERLPEAV